MPNSESIAKPAAAHALWASRAEERRNVSFPQVYRSHFRFVWNAVARLGVRDADIADVTQNVFIIVHRQLAGFKGEAAITTWLFSICRKVVKDYRKSAPYRREIAVDIGEIGKRAAGGVGPLHQLDTADLRKRLETILDKMSERLRVVFVFYELEEMSSKDIANLLEVPAPTIRSRLRIARAVFRREARRLARSAYGPR